MRTVPVFLILLLAATGLSATSLWLSPRNNERGMFGSQTATRVGDILTVVVNETASLTASQTSSTNRSSSLDHEIGQILYSAEALGWFTRNGEFPSTELSGSSSSNGGGSLTNTRTVSARFAVSVIDVLPNGHLILEGVRQISYGGETYFMVLNGIVRPLDIAADNTIDSSTMADARLRFVSEGSISEAQKKAWLIRMNDRYFPW